MMCEYLRKAMHNDKSLLSSGNRTKAVQSGSFAEAEKIIHVTQSIAASSSGEWKNRFSKLETSVEEKSKPMAQILHLL